MRKNMLAAIIGMALMAEGMPITTARKRTKPSNNGHTSWNTEKSARVIRWRKKEKRAKLARKINWD